MSFDVLPLGTARPIYDTDPLPDWVTSLRAPQVEAVREIIEAFNDGADVVMLDAPVGTGKTLIGELVRRELRVDRALYICSDKALQDQFVRDFPYARVLKGRANYKTMHGRGLITCDDCTSTGPGSACAYCSPMSACPYRVAKEEARAARVGVLNTSMMLTLTNYINDFTRNQLVIADECDLLESSLIGFVEYEVPQWIEKIVKLDVPKKGVRKPTLVRWLLDCKDAVDIWLEDKGETLEPKRLRAMQSFSQETGRVAQFLQKDIDAANRDEDDDSDGEESGRWIRDYETNTLKLRPVTVQQYGVKNLWRHGAKWLLMSGTVISGDEIADSLGLPLEYRTITVPSSFPVEHRPIIVAPIANPIRSLGEAEWDKLAIAIENICDKHEGRVLVHTVSYAMTKYLLQNTRLGTRRKVSYTRSGEKANALAEYLKHENAVMFAPSMDRGVDLAGDKCRVQIICKVPYPSLGDKQVSSRLRLPGGQAWYTVQAIRQLVQMTGRAVRSETDHATTYILDYQFVRNVLGKYTFLIPEYFAEALVTNQSPAWLKVRRKGAA